MTVATQLPFVSEYARQVGARTFRKQILPLADVEHPRHGTLSFTRERLRRLVERFRAGAYDLVPALLADAHNGHHDDMRLARGTVTDLDLGEDGLYATIEATEEGARLLEQFPNLPVSARIANRSGAEALAHVLMTPDPVVRGMRGWEPIEASATSGEVIDLSNGSFAPRRELVVLDEMGEPVELSDAERADSERIVWRDGLPYEPRIELSADEREEAEELAGLLAAWDRRG
jgi:hypothetical protein